MAYRLRQWPASVYPKEADDLAEARSEIDVALHALELFGPKRDEYGAKCLGKKWNGLWQLGFKVMRKQIRILYAPYKSVIVVFCIHRKTSPQEQVRAYERALNRKNAVERQMEEHDDLGEELPSIAVH